MAFFAKIDNNNIVKQIEVIDNSIATTEENGIAFLHQLHGDRFNWKQFGTAPFTSGGVQVTRNYAGINYTYDETRDKFIEPQPYPTWILNETTFKYEPPVAYPTDGNFYQWNEENQSWDLVE